ncbi:bud emergence protein 1 [Coemansia sp. RSA 1722]|nr:bud emergence protein 1 [Coemansia sp. RSA 486]KAJ2237865.1 bud emergence protein 1 [Coemansia sp. RSA 485]KAJ2603295.1 bud emergence protein 1 [Coemansia sp. RSA 1721]KAJ2605925.1 bud emergence protein 1 [Coemansia sp. RSA 1722]KAJ2639915.1 bud emergence protein 1 [Coemansia sp. RSA 1286]
MFNLGISNRTSTAAQPKSQQVPKRVIRARQDYIARETAELTFKKDDFFYVLSTPHADDQWYDVTNPLTGERGLVPAPLFEVLESRQDRLNRINRSAFNASATEDSRSSLGLPHSVPNSNSLSSVPQRSVSRSLSGKQQQQQRRPSEGFTHVEAEPMPAMPLRTRTSSIKKGSQHQRQHSQTINAQSPPPMPTMIEPQAVALYDFTAANGNELTIASGDDLIILAQSTEDWVIAKHTKRSGLAGLVPLSYIQLRDHVTGVIVSDLRAYLGHYNMRLRSAAEWEKQQRDVWVARSSRSSASTVSDLVIIDRHSNGHQAARHIRGSSGSSTSSAGNYENRSPTPKSAAALGGISPATTAASQNPRNRALTASSSSTSSIAERSSFRQLRKSSQPIGGSLQFMASENFPRFHKDEVADVSVPSFICKDGAYLFQVSLVFYTGDERNIYRTYEDFVTCRNELNEKFPAETSSLKLARFSMHSSSMLYLNDSIAERRRNELQEYVQGLIATPAAVVEGPTVQRLFGSRVETLPNRVSTPSRSLRRTPQPSMQGRSRHSPSLSTDSAMETQLTPASASSADTVVEATPIDIKGFSNMRIAKSLDGKTRPLTEVPPMPAEPHLQGIEQKRATQRLSHKPSTGTLGGSSMVKVKVRLGDDMVAMRLPSELTLSELKARIAHKLGSEESERTQPKITQIAYFSASGESEPLCDDQDWETALLATNYKPVLTIVQ